MQHVNQLISEINHIEGVKFDECLQGHCVDVVIEGKELDVKLVQTIQDVLINYTTIHDHYIMIIGVRYLEDEDSLFVSFGCDLEVDEDEEELEDDDSFTADRDYDFKKENGIN